MDSTDALAMCARLASNEMSLHKDGRRIFDRFAAGKPVDLMRVSIVDGMKALMVDTDGTGKNMVSFFELIVTTHSKEFVEKNPNHMLSKERLRKKSLNFRSYILDRYVFIHVEEVRLLSLHAPAAVEASQSGQHVDVLPGSNGSKKAKKTQRKKKKPAPSSTSASTSSPSSSSASSASSASLPKASSSTPPPAVNDRCVVCLGDNGNPVPTTAFGCRGGCAVAAGRALCAVCVNAVFRCPICASEGGKSTIAARKRAANIDLLVELSPEFAGVFLSAVGEVRAQLPAFVGTITLSLNPDQVDRLRREYPDNESTGWWFRESDALSKRRSNRRRSEVV